VNSKPVNGKHSVKSNMMASLQADRPLAEMKKQKTVS